MTYIGNMVCLTEGLYTLEKGVYETHNLMLIDLTRVKSTIFIK